MIWPVVFYLLNGNEIYDGLKLRYTLGTVSPLEAFSTSLKAWKQQNGERASLRELSQILRLQKLNDFANALEARFSGSSDSYWLRGAGILEYIHFVVIHYNALLDTIYSKSRNKESWSITYNMF